MKCPRCQQENPPQARFCLGCGARLALACAACGTATARRARFCSKCGQAGRPLAPAPQVTARSPRPTRPSTSPRRSSPRRPPWRASASRSRCCSPTSRARWSCSADRDPEEARKLLDPVLERMMEAVHRYEGTVNQVMGDGIMALFGAPLAHEDHAVRACYAALRMQEAVARYAEGVCRAHGVPVQIRVGLNSGEVVVRAIGQRSAHGLHGGRPDDAPGRAHGADGDARRDPARPRDPAARRRLRQVEARSARSRSRGWRTPVEVYELAGAAPLRSRLQAAAARGLTRFVGRDAELEQLRQALEPSRARPRADRGRRGRARRGQVAPRLRVHPLPPHPGLADPGGRLRVLRQGDQLPAGHRPPQEPTSRCSDRDGHREIREKVTGKLLTLDRALEPTLPALLALLDVPVEDAAVAGARSAAAPPAHPRRRQAPAAAREPGAAAARGLRGPPLDRLRDPGVPGEPGREPADRALLLLVNYRPEYQHGWGSKTLLHAAPAGRAAARERRRAAHGAAGHRRHRRAAQAPPHRADRRQSVLPGGERADAGRDAARSRGSAGPIDSSSLSTRSRCPPRCRRSWPRGSTGWPRRTSGCSRPPRSSARTCRSRSCCAIAELPEEDLRRGLARLQAAEFLYETSLFPDLEYTFKHALTHEVAYGGLLAGAPARAARADRRGDRDAPPGPPRRAHRAARPSRPPGRAAGEGGGLSPPGRDSRRLRGRRSRTPGLVRAGAGCPRGAAGEPVHAGAGLRDPPRAAAGADPAR